VPPDYADLLSGPIEVAVDADWETVAGEALPRIAIRRGSLTTDSVRATADGTLGDAVANLSLALNAARPDGAPIRLPFLEAPSTVGSIALTGTVAPSGGAVRLELLGRVVRLDLGGTRVPGLGLSAAVETTAADPLAGGELPFALHLEADAIATPTGRIESVAGRPLILTADGTFDTGTGVAETSARLAAAGGVADFTGAIEAGALRGRLAADFADLRPLSPLAGRTIAGAIDAVAEGVFSGGDTAFTVEGSGLDLDPGEPTLARLLGGVTGFRATVARQADGGLTVTDARIDGISFDATGALALSADDTMDATIDGALADLSLLAEQSSGAATFTARVTGSRQRPDVDATISVAEGRLSGQPIENAVVGFVGAPTDGGWQGALSLQGSVAGGPLAGTANVTVDAASGQVAFPDVDLAVGDNRIAGAIERTAAGPLAGALTVDAPRLETLAALALVDATGNGRADVRFAPDGDRQSVSDLVRRPRPCLRHRVGERGAR
jgi:translocation and assembly module TamB